MPKTYTDDIAPALPSSIDGPFQVVDPSDSASWIKIDPANAQVTAAGDARPTRAILTTYTRLYGSTTSCMIGNIITARYVGPSSLGGMYYGAIQVPLDMDITKPSKVKILVSPTSDSTTNGQVIQFSLDVTYVKEGEGANEYGFAYNWDVPDDWTTNDFNVVTIDNGNGHTFNANTLAQGHQIGIRAARGGIAPQDTFSRSVKISEHLIFEYTAKEF